MKRSHLVGAVATLAISAIALGTPRAQADPDPKPPVTSDVAQLPADEIGGRDAWQESIWDYTTALEDAASESVAFAGAAFDNETKSFTLYGSGKPTPRVQALLDAAPSSVQVNWSQVPFGGEILDDASARVLALPGVSTVSLARTFDYLEISTTTLKSALPASVLGVPVVVVGSGATTALDGRGDESAPYSGGGRIYEVHAGVNESACSTGFRAYSGNQAVMVTAAHCSARTTNGNYVPTVGYYVARLAVSNGLVGTYSESAPAKDVQLIRNQSYDGNIWNGESNASTAVALANSGAGVLSLNESVCVSGGYSGTQCGRVTALSVDYDLCDPTDATMPDCYAVYGGTEIISNDGSAVAGQGDSGSGVYQWGAGERHPAGIVSAARFTANERACPAWPRILGVDRTCYDRILISSWTDFKNDFAVDLTLAPN